ncbi:carboxypeptidase-like regulatory domain-containing protein [Mariniflexile aquimaris]|uniref:Carboxypeptidase-like regulatory domain-containing protein n=1 Tax=Mariniflexile aquimaris TaxID=881009 RepID=A0ABW3BVF6_9FLAO
MERKFKKTITFFTFLLFVIFSNNAQNDKKKESLTYVFNAIEVQYRVQFNYAEDTVKAIFLIPPDESLSLNESLTYLETQTGLSFSIMSDGIVLVKPKESLVLCGYLKDKDNSQPLASATIQTSNNFTTTNENGFFQIKVTNITQPITIRFLGYKTAIKWFYQFSKSDCEDVFLLPNFQSLSEVVVSNFITSGISKLNNGSFEINFSEFDMLPGLIDNDVLQSVQAFPGIQSINETVSNINIRGGTHDQNLILWDDIKMYQSGHFFGLISMYNPQITQTVTLRKNGSDVSYTDGVSGTIAMQTNQSVNNNFNATLGINLTDTNAFVDIPINQSSSVQVAARKSISDFFETPTYNAFFDRISQNTEVSNNANTITNTDKTFDFYDTSLRWIYKINDKDELRINFINVYNELQFNENALINEKEESRESNLTQYSIAGALHYNRIWNNNFQTTFEAYETDYKLKAVNVDILDSHRFLQENIVSETSLKLKTNYSFNEALQLISGYHFVETKVTNLDDVDTPLFRLLVSEVVRTHGVFSQLGYRSANGFSNFNFGVRYNFIEKFSKSIWEPRLSFSQRFLDFFTIEVLGEFKHQNTSQVINFQNDFLGIEKRRWQLSNNNDIPVITSKQLSLGLNYSHRGWLFNIEGYIKHIEGITAQSQGFQNQFEFSKTKGDNRVSGVDVLFRKHLNKFNTWISYAYMDNTYRFKDLQPNYFPSNYNIKHAATLGMTYSLANLKLSAGLNWNSGKPTTLPISGNEIVNGQINYEVVNNSNLEDYLRLDISALYNFELTDKTKVNVGASILNVLNKENQINRFYKVNNDELNAINQHSLGITPNAVLRVHF